MRHTCTLLLCSLVCVAAAAIPPATLRSWPLPGSGGSIRLRSSEQRFDRSREVTGDSVWAGTMCLLQWLSEPQNRGLFEGKSVLELGSGTGIIGLSLAQMGARRVVLTDLEQQLPLLRSNIAFNEDDHAGCLVSAAALPWGERPTGALARERFDLILGCEVMYIDALLEPLACTTAALLLDPPDASPSPPPVALFAAARHRAFASVPDHAHTFVHDLLEARHGLHSRLVGSVERPAEVVGADFFAGAQEAERDMPVSFFRVSSQRDEVYAGFGGGAV